LLVFQPAAAKSCHAPPQAAARALLKPQVLVDAVAFVFHTEFSVKKSGAGLDQAASTGTPAG